MDVRDALRKQLEMSDMICMGYVKDLSDEELLKRPCPGCNHVNWQLGHLVAAEHEMMSEIAPGGMPPLPEGFAERYSKETAASDDGAKFVKKDALLGAAKAQREATLKAIATVPEQDFSKPTGRDYAPTLIDMLGMQATHWLMHAGQWAVVRRQLGRPPLF